MIKHEILETTIISGEGLRPHFPDMTIPFSIVTHYQYSSIEDAKADGYDDPKKYKVRMTIEYEEIAS